MNIKRWFLGKLKRALRDHQELAEEPRMNNIRWDSTASPIVGHQRASFRSGECIRSNGMNFTLYNASGGYVLEYHTYNEKADTTENRIHIIHDTADFGDQLAKILTIELLRQ